MPKYAVTMPVHSSATFFVTADSEDHAKDLAIERFDGHSIGICYSCNGKLDEPVVSGEVVSVRQASEEEFLERMEQEDIDADYEVSE